MFVMSGKHRRMLTRREQALMTQWWGRPDKTRSDIMRALKISDRQLTNLARREGLGRKARRHDWTAGKTLNRKNKRYEVHKATITPWPDDMPKFEDDPRAVRNKGTPGKVRLVQHGPFGRSSLVGW